MTNELLTQIVRKNKMYVEWKTTPVTSADHEQIKVLEKCTKNLIGHSRLDFNNHESNIDC